MKQPNILLIHADQLRWDCLGYAGNKDVKTPNLDWLSQGATGYTNHYTVYPICTPSRYSLFSGMYVHQHLAWDNKGTLPAGFETFPSLLQKKGYRTEAVGKMHFNPTYHDIGFDSMQLAEQNGKGRYEDDYHRWLMEQGRIDRVDLHNQSGEYRESGMEDYNVDLGATPSDLPKELHSTSWTTQRALEALSKWDDDGGNLLMVGYIKPHHPFDPPAPYSTMYDADALTLLPGYCEKPLSRDEENNGSPMDYHRMDEKKLRQVMALYYGTITHMDEGIGNMLDLLREKGLYDDTMIIFTSDHGEYMGYHHMLLKCNYLYEPLAKIPLLIKYPHQTEARIDERLCENIDIAPTLLEQCDIAVPVSMEGDSLKSKEKRNIVFSEGQYGTDESPCIGYMLRDERYKLILHGSFQNGMLFDLLNDPNEFVNLFEDSSCAEVRNAMIHKLTEKMLFVSPTKSHSNQGAKALRDSDKLLKQANEIKQFISSRW